MSKSMTGSIGDHPILNFLNTVSKVDGELVDSLHSGDDVRHWLAQAGLPADTRATKRPRELLGAARWLREMIRTTIERRKGNQPVDVRDLNAFLSKCESHLQIVPATRGCLRAERHWGHRTAEQILAPIAEAAAELLATGDFNLVRRCEDRQCVLWFYDRTKSHHRRWCSMTSCGNRNKVAAFRERQQSLK